MAAETYSSISENVARRFLQTIVVVDDEAFLQQSPAGVEQAVPLVEPSSRGEPVDSVKKTAEVEIAPDYKRPSGHLRQLDAKLLIDSFALQGLVCAVLAPGKDEQLATHIHALSENADVIVLDWTIHKDGGATALTIVDDIMGRDRRKGGRIRLIVIYTGEPNVKDACYTVLRSRITSLQSVDGEGLTLQDGTTRIVFLRKRHDDNVAGVEAFKESELPDRVVREFTKFAGGVLPNSVMSSVAAIRERTHSLIGRFAPGLDGPYLAHRVLLHDVEDAKWFLIDLIGDEIKAILESTLDGSAGDGVALEAFVRMKCESQEFRTIVESADKPAKVKNVTLDEVVASVAKGLNGVPEAWGSKKSLFRRIHPLFHDSAPTGKERSQSFACLSAMRSDHTLKRAENAKVPVLNLGTVIAKQENEKQTFLVCLQPVCDCVRLGVEHNHPFIFGSLVSAETSFDIVVPDAQGKYIQLSFEEKASKTVVLSFAGSGGGRIESVPFESGFSFKASDGSNWLWVGELRFKHAQRFVHRLSSELSRVGLDEFEWQRKYAE